MTFYRLSGADGPGIVAGVSEYLASKGINIDNLETRIGIGNFFVLQLTDVNFEYCHFIDD